jgi:hypothetical protein
MSEQATSATPQELRESDFLRDLRLIHGDLMDGKALAGLLKFGSDRSFRRAAARGTLPVSVFRIKGRSGWFVTTRDVAAWMAGVSVSAGSSNSGRVGDEAPKGDIM